MRTELLSSRELVQVAIDLALLVLLVRLATEGTWPMWVIAILGALVLVMLARDLRRFRERRAGDDAGGG